MALKTVSAKKCIQNIKEGSKFISLHLLWPTVPKVMFEQAKQSQFVQNLIHNLQFRKQSRGQRNLLTKQWVIKPFN